MSEPRIQQRFPLFLVPLGLLVLALWAMMSPSEGASVGGSPAGGSVAVLLVFFFTFSALALNLVGRLAAVACGAVASLLLGVLLGFYLPKDAALYLGGKLDTLGLLAGVGAVTGVLHESGFFELLAARTVRASSGSRRRVMVYLCLLTYGLSMFVNNLAAILVIVPLSLRIADALEMDPVSLVLGEVIASNLGGASTMVGDFPNMLIATETGMPFHEFLGHLAPVCLLQLGILLMFISPTFTDQPASPSRRAALSSRLESARWNKSGAQRGLLILGAMVIGFLACGQLGVSPAVVAGVAALAAFLFGEVPWRQLARRMCLDEVLFFACLFVMVGAVDASGVLDGIGASVGDLWLRSPVWGAIVLLWGAALLTCVLNAGPTTALLLHVLLAALGGSAPEEAIWWALSLGVCAGSSATLTGATAGPVAAGLLERRGLSLTFGRFARTGLPLMLTFLAVSSCYLAILLTR